MTDDDPIGDDLVEVRLLQVPLVLRERSRQHGADLLREMELLRSGEQGGTATHPAPRRLLQLSEELDRVYGPYVASTTQEMDAALDRGEESLPEVVHRLPGSSADFIAHLAQVLAEVEEFCRSGDLLAMAPPPDIAAYRAWAMSEVRRQCAGQPPTPWPVFAARAGG